MFSEKNFSNNNEKLEKMLNNTENFREALESGNLVEAENFLNDIASNPEKFPQYDERWLDHRQRELFQSYYKAEDWQGAKRVVEATADSQSQEGRRNRLEELSGLKYDEI
jgi:hypothetical protein